MNCYEDLVYRGLIKDSSSEELKNKLNNESLTFYIGTDPTADSLHIGHFSSFLIATRLKRYGHNPLLLIGGATAQIGDPKPTAERTIAKKEVIEYNAKCLSEQAKKIFGMEIVNNYDWSKDINFIDFLRDYGKFFSVNYMLDKDIIRRRIESGITYTEFSYMIMQALDFEYLYRTKNCTMQVAGSDQWGNITAGIDLIRKKDNAEVYGFTMPLITDKSGHKFGKSEGNALWLDKEKTSNYELYQFFLNCEDEMIIDYLKVFTFLTKEEIETIEKEHLKRPEERIAQKTLAKEVITFIRSKEDYDDAVKVSNALFNEDITKLSKNDIINNLKGVPTFNIKEENIVDILVNNKLCQSKREAREMINGNAISVNNKKVTQEEFIISKDIAIDNSIIVIKKGKKNYYIGLFN